MKLERRVLTVGNLEVRQLDDGTREYRGDAIRFGEPSEDLGGFIEYVDADAEIAGDDVRHLINHDPNLVLGRTTSGTTKLDRSGTAIGVTTDMPDTSYARDLEVSIARRDVSQMSFGFRVIPRADGAPGDSWDFSTSPAVRHLRAIELSDVSTVTYPAYPTTTAEVRALVDEHSDAEPADDYAEQLAALRALVESMEARAGKTLSAANAEHVQGMADAVDALGPHLEALLNAADLSNDAGTDDDGAPGETNGRPSDAELRLYEALENVMHVKPNLDDRV